MKRWELYKELLADVLLAFLALFYLAHLVAFIIIGPVTIGEANQVILGTEVVVLVGITALALERFIAHNMNKNKA